MSDRFVGPKLSDNEIKRRAETCASKYFYINKARFEQIDILDIIEFQLEYFAPGFQFAVVEDKELLNLSGDGTSEYPIVACTDPRTKTIYVSLQLYKDAHLGDAWARTCLAHELGHAILHSEYTNRTPHVAFKYSPTVTSVDETKIRGIPLFRDSERQAEIFAVFLLVPDALVTQCQDAKTLSKLARVDMHAAKARLKFYDSERAGKIPSLGLRNRVA